MKYFEKWKLNARNLLFTSSSLIWKIVESLAFADEKLPDDAAGKIAGVANTSGIDAVAMIIFPVIVALF